MTHTKKHIDSQLADVPEANSDSETPRRAPYLQPISVASPDATAAKESDNDVRSNGFRQVYRRPRVGFKRGFGDLLCKFAKP